MQYEWTEPRRIDRNAKIVAYIITDTRQNSVDINYTVKNPTPYNQSSAIFHEPYAGLLAETTYFKKVFITESDQEIIISFRWVKKKNNKEIDEL